MTVSPPRHYLFTLTDGGGTVPPELGAVRRLIQRGHRVRVLAEDSMVAQVEDIGAEPHCWQRAAAHGDGPEHSAYRDWEIRSPLGLARGMADHMIAGPSRRHAQDTMAQIVEDRPDHVVTSFVAFGAMAAAQAAELSFDVLIPNIYPLPARGLPAMGMGLKPARTSAGRIRDRIANALSARVLGHYALPRLNAVREELGLPAVRSPWDQVHAARRQLVLSSRQFEFPAEFPATVRHVGPILDEPAWTCGDEWSAPTGHEPLVLVALSSTYQGQESTVQNVIDALSGLPVHGLVTTGPGLEPGLLSGSANVDVVSSAPHHEVMKHAALVITHGGHGTVMKTVLAGVPMVVMPHGRDQPDTAVRVSERGAGLTVAKNASVPVIAEAVTEALTSPAYSRSAERLGRRVREDIDHSMLLEELEFR